MIKFILIFYTQTSSIDDLLRIEKILGGLENVLSWTLDLQDCDRVLRVMSGVDLSKKIQETFNDLGIISELMAVYLGNPESSLIGDVLSSSDAQTGDAS
ncbi:hypothetical protein [Pedobacter frigidisoli]|uniref:hypothetical protein n=1 Tax=Pedobacter frigidisoli TaxID=2530455 RepID=UPI002930BDC7|nr:hypothetical protein [Pedobacter frigidisoli]